MRVIQLLNWKLKTIEKELENIEKQGFDAIQINPMQPFKEEKEFRWWSSYQPLGFRIGNMFGEKEDLKHLCDTAASHNLDIIVDVVLNHTANKSGEKPYVPHSTVDKILLENPNFWKPQIELKNGDDRWEATLYPIGLAGLDLTNIELQEIIFNYLQELKNCGVKGLRFDAAKHIGLPNDGVDFFEKARDFMALNEMYGYGEFIGGNKEWRDEMAELLMVLAPHNSTITNLEQFITFFESHDTYLNTSGWLAEHTRNLTEHDLTKIYEKLSRMYNNTLAYVRPNDENDYYCRNTKGLTCEEVYKLDEREHFTRLYFSSPEIRQANKTKKKLK